MKAWPVKKLTATSSRPSWVLRVKVSVLSRISTSISPDCRTVKRTFAVVARYLTFSGSPSTAAAIARQ